MTDEERRKKLIIDLRGYEGHDRRLNTMLHQAANDIERLERERDSVLNLLYQESERRAEESQRIEQLEKDVEALKRM
jgi:hypothetical protein